jgi:DNA repair protein RecO (recombination protein O)
MAKGVRKSKSKLAGGIELFSVSDLTFIAGRGEINTLISSRLIKNYGNIVKNIERTNAAYDAIKLINKATEEEPEEAYFQLLQSVFIALDDADLEPALALLWFQMQLLKLSGHSPNLKTDISGAKLEEAAKYSFHPDQMRFDSKSSSQANFTVNHIKFLRIGFGASTPRVLERIEQSNNLANEARPLILAMLKSFIRA